MADSDSNKKQSKNDTKLLLIVIWVAIALLIAGIAVLLVLADRYKQNIEAKSGYAGWLTVSETVIDYPLVKTADNEKYLDTTFNGSNEQERVLLQAWR
jgi:flagellar basal body-associated protein FliL